jgi:hypothetical protein
MNDDERLALAIVRARATDVPMRICSEAEAEELPQLRARIAALEAERGDLTKALKGCLDEDEDWWMTGKKTLERYARP